MHFPTKLYFIPESDWQLSKQLSCPYGEPAHSVWVFQEVDRDTTHLITNTFNTTYVCALHAVGGKHDQHENLKKANCDSLCQKRRITVNEAYFR